MCTRTHKKKKNKLKDKGDVSCERKIKIVYYFHTFGDNLLEHNQRDAVTFYPVSGRVKKKKATEKAERYLKREYYEKLNWIHGRR